MQDTMQNPYGAPQSLPVSQLGVDARAGFIVRTYQHLLGAIIAFVAIEVFLFSSGIAESMAQVMLSGSWLLVLGAFILVSWIASRVAHTSQSMTTQYLALGGFVVAEAIIFVPMLYMAQRIGEGIISSAAFVTLVGFGCLTAVAFITRKDFSFLRGVLTWGGFVALGLIVAGALFGFHLGIFFTVGMIAFAGAAILYDTSNVLHHFPEDRHVGASLELFASVALLFWYVLQFAMSLASSD